MRNISVAQIYDRHGFSPYHIDIAAGVPPGTTSKMMRNVPVSRRNAKTVLLTLSMKTKSTYNLTNVSVRLVEEEGDMVKTFQPGT
jgi:hypothetical protein